jgi:DtxR family Mn-dependent transcriptional regulator
MRYEKHRKEDEILEELWYLRENGKLTFAALEERHADDPTFHETVADMVNTGVMTAVENKVAFTPAGEEVASGVIRRHRLAERLLVDALGLAPEETEQGACEFEHIIAPEIAESICTLLGHPRACPHGHPIPEGVCCKEARDQMQSPVVPITRMKVGVTAKVAYINADSEAIVKKLLLLGVTPGVEVKMTQSYPAVVIELVDNQIAMENDIADAIHVWRVPREPRRG